MERPGTKRVRTTSSVPPLVSTSASVASASAHETPSPSSELGRVCAMMGGLGFASASGKPLPRATEEVLNIMADILTDPAPGDDLVRAQTMLELGGVATTRAARARSGGAKRERGVDGSTTPTVAEAESKELTPPPTTSSSSSSSSSALGAHAST